jgi:pilus assembly protein CpaB
MRRPIIFVLLAGFAALVAAMVVYSALKKREAEVQEAKLQSVDIVVAAHALGIGTKLDASSIRTARWSRDALPPGAFTDPSAVINKYTKTSFVENEPIVADWLFGGDKNAGVLPLLIPDGMRALSVPVDEVSDIAGFVLPHAHVDVIVSATADKPLTKIVLQNVEVLAIAQDIEQVNDKATPVHVVTMLVTPDQAERLTLASGQGGLRLALRNYDDKNVVATNGVTVAQLLGAQPAAPPTLPVEQHMVYAAPRPRPKPVNVDVMRNGSSNEVISFVRAHGGSDAPMEAAPADSAAPPDAAPAGDSSSADSPSNFVGAGSATPLDAPTAASVVPTVSALGGPTGSSLGRVPASEPVLMNSAAAAGSAAPASGAGDLGGYSGPRSKTIDVP